ncbi:MAG TPA: glycerophosphodiester phosphodiesterase [Vicinamibacterales bacterium]|nr:glycerophosphodiester phosphodiesterase [Vicinamibacterales bacterium]
MVRTFVAVALIAAGASLAGAPLPAAMHPIIIGHRGASGHRPEHTIESYRLAIEMGADYIEPDLVSTKDGVLIARHENEIGGTTDVAAKFPDRRRTATIDGQTVTGWFTEDFTLAEIKTLRARERLEFRSHTFDGQFDIPTFDEVIEFAQRRGRETGRTIGIYPETKHPTYFRTIGRPLEEHLLASLQAHGWNTRESPVFIQSFETENLRALRHQTTVRLILLLDSPQPQPLDDTRLRDIASYADGVGLNTRLVIPAGPNRRLLPPTDIISRAHAAGLLVHVWTLRKEPTFLSPTYNGDFEAEFRQFRDLGVDGIFTDFPDVGRKVIGR